MRRHGNVSCTGAAFGLFFGTAAPFSIIRHGPYWLQDRFMDLVRFVSTHIHREEWNVAVVLICSASVGIIVWALLFLSLGSREPWTPSDGGTVGALITMVLPSCAAITLPPVLPPRESW